VQGVNKNQKTFKVNFLRNSQPEPEDYLWRYVNLKKFLSFIIDQKLHLKRLDQFEDKNDGIFANLLHLKYNISRIKNSGKKADILEEERKIRELQRNLFASCWFVGNTESIAMWKIFSNPDSVAVRIKYKYLKEIFKKQAFHCEELDIESITLGKVQYYDYQNQKVRKSLIDADAFIAFTKDESFSNEKEFRIVIRTGKGEENHVQGIDLQLLNFRELPFEIVFHPKAEDWGVKNLIDIMDKFNVHFKNINSELNLRFLVGIS
jgi:hypothetical protein